MIQQLYVLKVRLSCGNQKIHGSEELLSKIISSMRTHDYSYAERKRWSDELREYVASALQIPLWAVKQVEFDVDELPDNSSILIKLREITGKL